jgi:hypothetical protein
MQTQDFELPSNTPDEDIIVLNNLLTALMNIGKEHKTCITSGYKVDFIDVGYLLRVVLPATDIFEFSLEELLWIKGVNPARVDRVNVCRSATGGPCEIVVKVLNSKQRLMTVSNLSFVGIHKRSWSTMAAS